MTWAIVGGSPALAVSCDIQCGNGICEPDIGEDCLSCAADCLGSRSADPPGCDDDLICEPHLGEDCINCPGDCNGKTTGGPPSSLFCCGEGPEPCSPSACNQEGFLCSEAFCCGDGDGEGPLACSDPLCTATTIQAYQCQNTGVRCGCGNPLCDEQVDIDLAIACDGAMNTITVNPHVCGTAPAAMTKSLLRIAVHCFDSTEAPGQEADAQFTDAHGFGFDTFGVFDAND